MRGVPRRVVGGSIATLGVGAGMLGWFAPLGLDGPGQTGLAILIAAAALWITEAVPLYVTSFVILALAQVWLGPALVEAGSPAPRDAFTSPFFSDIILLFLGGLSLSAALNKLRYDEQLARWVIRVSGSSVPLLLAGIMALSAFLSMFLSNTATTAMMLTLCLPIARSLKPGDASRKAIILSVPFAANIGGVGTPIGTPPNAIAVQYLAQSGDPIGFGRWMLLGIPFVLIMLGVVWATLLLVHRGSRGAVRLERQAGDSIRVSWRRRLVLVVAVLTVAGWLTGPWHGFSSGTVALLPVIVLFATGVLDRHDLRGLSWDVLLIMGGGLCLGVVMATSGFAAWFVGHLPTDDVPAWAVLAVLGVAAAGMSSVMSNTASANLLMPIVLGLGAAAGPEALLTVAFACSVAMPLPISTPPNAIAFSSGELTVGDMLKPGLIITAVAIVVELTFARAWWGWVGGFS
ncbi:MAG: DASS family sodium-coupled anion symporter [Phycisphaerales bacterium]